MKLTDFPLLTDENIAPAVASFLREAGFDVRDVIEDHLFGSSDRHLLDLAVSEGRVVVTRDSDFGTLVVGQHQPVIGATQTKFIQELPSTFWKVADGQVRKTSFSDILQARCPQLSDELAKVKWLIVLLQHFVIELAIGNLSYLSEQMIHSYVDKLRRCDR